MTDTPLAWLHIGDRHLKQPGNRNRRDLDQLVALEASLPAWASVKPPHTARQLRSSCTPTRSTLRDPATLIVVEFWPAKGVVGGRLGPDRNGRAW